VAREGIDERGGLDWKRVINSSGMKTADKILGDTEFSKSNRQKRLRGRGA